MMNRLKLIKFSALVLLSFSLTQQAHGQVTIGANIPPQSGSLLDLKEDDSTDNNSKKGVAMPRVNLTIPTMLYPMFDGDAAYKNNQNNTKKEQDALHTGLIVYNINECFTGSDTSRGLFVWTGSKWQNLKKRSSSASSSDVRTYSDQDGNYFRAKLFGGGAGEWMIQNLQVKTFDDGSGTSLSNTPDTPVNGMAWKHPVNNESYPEIGYLYNGAAMLNNLAPGTGEQTEENSSGNLTSTLPVGHQGICPSGWHVPSDMEWVELEKELYENASKYSTQADLSGWNWNTTSENLAVPNLGEILTDPCLLRGNNESVPNQGNGKSNFYLQGGFSAKMAEGAGAANEYVARFWTSSGSQGGDLWTRYTMTKYNTDGTQSQHLSSLNRIGTATADQWGYVRCKKDDEIFKCGAIMTDRDGNRYNTASFGNKCWFTSNVRSVTYSDGSAIASSDYTTLGDVNHLGRLYSWEAATQNTPNDFVMIGEAGTHTSDVQGICPDGWFVASDNDWNELEKYIDTNYTGHITPSGTVPSPAWDDDYASATGYRPETDTPSWALYLKWTTLNGWSNAAAGKGFALPGSGATLEDNTPLTNWGDYSQVWTSSAAYTPVGSDDAAIYRSVSKNNNQVYRGKASRTAKLSVRCVQPIQ